MHGGLLSSAKRMRSVLEVSRRGALGPHAVLRCKLEVWGLYIIRHLQTHEFPCGYKSRASIFKTVYLSFGCVICCLLLHLGKSGNTAARARANVARCSASYDSILSCARRRGFSRPEISLAFHMERHVRRTCETARSAALPACMCVVPESIK